MFDFGLTTDQEERAQKLHESSVAIDMLAESTLYEALFLHLRQGGLTTGSYTVGCQSTLTVHQKLLTPSLCGVMRLLSVT